MSRLIYIQHMLDVRCISLCSPSLKGLPFKYTPFSLIHATKDFLLILYSYMTFLLMPSIKELPVSTSSPWSCLCPSQASTLTSLLVIHYRHDLIFLHFHKFCLFLPQFFILLLQLCNFCFQFHCIGLLASP